MDTLSASAQDLSPAVEFEVQLALIDTFGLTEEELMVYAEFDPRQWAGEFDKCIGKAGVINAGALLAAAMGYPCDPVRHQRPHDMINTFPLVLSPDWYETPEEFEFVVWLFFVWASEILKIAESSEDIEVAMERVKTMSILMAYYFGDDDRRARCCKLDQSINMINDLLCMHGCLDLQHDFLIDRETPVIRELAQRRGQK